MKPVIEPAVKPAVTLRLLSDAYHTSLVVTGFLLLERQGEIALTIRDLRGKRAVPHPCLVEAILSGDSSGKGDITAAYDMLDGYNFDRGLANAYLETVDFYFKRSFSAEENQSLSRPHIIHPLGFYYYVTAPGNPLDRPSRPLGLKEHIRALLHGFKSGFTVEAFEQEPTYDPRNSPKILFCAKLWNPLGEPGERSITGELRAERERLNTMRIGIIRQLRQRYGSDFLGGVTPGEFARQTAPDLLLGKNITNKFRYISLLKAFDICIGTMGLHRSIGGKTAEYIAASKAIVAEQFAYEVPGDFREGTNALFFASKEECLAKVEALAADRERILRMQQNNAAYYREYMRPDRQIARSLRLMLAPAAPQKP